MNLSKSFNWISLFIILLVSFLIYSNSFTVAFQFDDGVHIVKLEKIQSFEHFSNLNYWTNINERPLAFFSLALNYSLHEGAVFGYHLFNLLIHFISGLLVFFLSLLILKRQNFNNGLLKNNEAIAALFIALIFISHSIQTQAVTYVIQRMASMAAMFYLGSLYFYLKARIEITSNKKIFFYILTIVFAIAALMCKQIAASLPIAILLLELFFVRTNDGRIYKNYLLIFSALLFSLLLLVILFGYLPKEPGAISRTDYFITQLGVLVKYMQLLIFPISQNLDYDFSISNSILEIKSLVSLLINIAVIYLALRLFRKHRLISFGIIWFYISLLVESSIIPIKDVIFEHRLYLPMFGFAFIIVALVFNYFTIKKRNYVFLILSVLVLIYGFRTYERNKVWRSGISLWQDVTMKSPNKARGHQNLGIAYFNAGQQQAALRSFDRCIDLDVHRWQAYYNRASVNSYLNNYKDAIKDLDDCIALKNDYPDAYDARGLAKMQRGDLESAVSDFDQAIFLNPELESAWFNRANAFVLLQNIDQAMNDFDCAIELNPQFVVAYNNRAQVKIFLNDYSNAIEDLDIAIAIDKTFVNAYNNRAKAYTALKDFRSAIDNYTISMHFDNQNPLVYRNRGLCFVQLKMYEQALMDFESAFQLGDEESQSYIDKIKQL